MYPYFADVNVLGPGVLDCDVRDDDGVAAVLVAGDDVPEPLPLQDVMGRTATSISAAAAPALVIIRLTLLR